MTGDGIGEDTTSVGGAAVDAGGGILTGGGIEAAFVPVASSGGGILLDAVDSCTFTGAAVANAFVSAAGGAFDVV